MTDKEINDLLIQWRPLIMKIALQYRNLENFDPIVDFDERVSIGMLVLAKAIETHDASIGPFPQWVGVLMKRAMNKEYRRLVGMKRNRGNSVDVDNAEESLQLVAPEVGSRAAELAELAEAIGKLEDPKHRKFMGLLLEGYNLKDAGKKMGVSKQAAHQWSLVLFPKLRKLLK